MSIFGMIDEMARKWLDWRLERAVEAGVDEAIKLTKKRSANERGVTFMLTYPTLITMTKQCMVFLKSQTSKDYVQMELQSGPGKDDPAFVLTIAKKDQEDPATKAVRLSKEVDRLKAEIGKRHNAAVEAIASRNGFVDELINANCKMVDALANLLEEAEKVAEISGSQAAQDARKMIARMTGEEIDG